MSLIHDHMDDALFDEHTVVESKPHWSTLKRKFIAAFSAITVIKPSKDDHRAAKVCAKELLAMRESEPELTNARWTAKLDLARLRAEQVEYDAEVSLIKHWKLAVREQEMQEESEPLPSVSIAAPYVIRQQPRPFYSYAEEQAAMAMSTMPVRRMAAPSLMTPRRIAVAGAIAGVIIAIGCIAARGGSPAAMASARPSTPWVSEQAKQVTAPVTMRATAEPVQLTTDATRLPPIEHRFDQPITPTVPAVAPIVEEIAEPAVADEAPVQTIERAPAPKKHKRKTSKSSRAKVSVAERAPSKAIISGKRRPITVNTSTALGDLRPSRR